MLPVNAPVLRLCEIAEYWSREINDLLTSSEIFDRLLSSFWLDVLRVSGSNGVNQVDRRAILKLVNRRRVHPGFSLTASAQDRPFLERLPSGDVIVDITKYVVLPADEANWTDDLI